MGLLSFNPGNFSDALAGLSQGLLAYGSGQPQGLLTVPAIVARSRQDRLQNTRQQQLLDMEQQKFGLEKTKLEQEQSQYAAHQAAMDEFIKTHPEYAPYIKTFGDAASAPILKKEFPEPFKINHETRPNGRTNEYGYYDQTGQWHTETTSPMDAPQSPRDQWETYRDPSTGMTGQRNVITGKIDWDPGQGGGIQVDTNGDGVADIVVGGKGMKSSESDKKAANQYTLLDDGINNLEKLISNGGVSPGKVALADTLTAKGPIPNYLSQKFLLGPKEKQTIAARSGAIEALANAITGAAFTDEQKNNFISMLPQPTDDDETFKAKISTMKAFINQLRVNAGPAAPAAAPTPSGNVEKWERDPKTGKPRKVNQ